MPKGKKAGKVKDKWREKQWVVVEAPPSFGSTPIAYVPITDSQKALGRTVDTTLFDLVKQDPQQYAIKLYFQIDKIEGGRASTVFKGHEYSREYLRSLVRRGSSMVSVIQDYTVKDQVRVRVYTVVFAQNRINSSRKHAIRLITHKILQGKTAALTYEQFAQEAVLGKIASDIYNAAKRIAHLRHVGVRKTKLLRKGEEMRPEAEETEAATPEPPPSLELEKPLATLPTG